MPGPPLQPTQFPPNRLLPPAPLQTLSLLLPVVQQHPALSCLSLNHAARDVECMEEVAHLLASCTQLQQLGLCGCNLEPAVGGEMGGGGEGGKMPGLRVYQGRKGRGFQG